MWYVYEKHIVTGREEFLRVFELQKEAVKYIASCYIGDKEYVSRKGEYYYFMKQH